MLMKEKKIRVAGILFILLFTSLLTACGAGSDGEKDRIVSLYGVNQPIQGSYDEDHAVKCRNGTFVGLAEEGVVSFKGVPYAEPPVGERRWKAPVPAADRDGLFEAYYYGCAPIQTEWPSEPGSYYPQSEDCLRLNIWVNEKNDSEAKPVMVFFHGGSYGWGSTADPMYDGHDLVHKYDDLILVTVEFRAGILGFIDLSSVEGGQAYRESGNLGLLDQKCALEWVRDNIAAFGGDPDNVTICGESSGAGSVSLLPLMEGTQGLFRRVIAESGSVALTYSREECQNLTEMLLAETGCATMEELTGLSEEELKSVNEKLNDYNNFPERDGIILPEDLYGAYREGRADGIDLLIGTNADEVKYWVWEMGYTVPVLPGRLTYALAVPVMYENNERRFSEDEKADAQAFLAMQSGSRIEMLSEFYNETLFRIPAMQQAALHAERGNRTYAYYWTYPCADEQIGACHAVELAYVFNHPEVTIYTGDHYNEALAGAVQEMWVNFARTGDPSTDRYKWAPYDSTKRNTMVLGADIHMESDIKAAQRKAIEPLLHHYFNGNYMQMSFNVPQTYRIAGLLAAVIAVIIALSLYVGKRRKR
ncbi:MAG: carboxylesterase/lipase family protein [Firmicutes bacterium]|nr:carboxylesterase/lipase family protein [Bacillota bacterium]